MSLWSGLKSLGLLEMLVYAPEYSAELIRHRFDRFDRDHGTDTNTSVSVGDLDATGASRASAELYWPIRSRPFARMMAAVAQDLSAYTFVDLGCGKGRGLLLAAQHPFRCIVGVEFSPRLCGTARDNLRIVAARQAPGPQRTQVLCIDACSYAFPAEPLVVFLFDPFGPAVLRPVVSNLVASLKSQPRSCFIAYHLPMHDEVFLEAGFQVVHRQRRGLHLAYPWVVMRWP